MASDPEIRDGARRPPLFLRFDINERIVGARSRPSIRRARGVSRASKLAAICARTELRKYSGRCSENRYLVIDVLENDRARLSREGRCLIAQRVRDTRVPRLRLIIPVPYAGKERNSRRFDAGRGPRPLGIQSRRYDSANEAGENTLRTRERPPVMQRERVARRKFLARNWIGEFPGKVGKMSLQCLPLYKKSTGFDP